SSAAIAPLSAPADVPKIVAMRGQRTLSRSRCRNPSSMCTPFTPPPERTTPTSRRGSIPTRYVRRSDDRGTLPDRACAAPASAPRLCDGGDWGGAGGDQRRDLEDDPRFGVGLGPPRPGALARGRGGAGGDPGGDGAGTAATDARRAAVCRDVRHRGPCLRAV